MTPGMKQTLVIGGFGTVLIGLIWLRGRGGNSMPVSAPSEDQLSFPVPSTVSPLQSPLFAGVYTSPPTMADTFRNIMAMPLQVMELLNPPRTNSSAENAGCCSSDKCSDNVQRMTYPLAYNTPMDIQPQRSPLSVNDMNPFDAAARAKANWDADHLTARGRNPWLM